MHANGYPESGQSRRSDGVGGEAADDRAVCEVHEHRDDRRLAPVVAQHEAGGFQQREVVGRGMGRAHARVNDGKQNVDEGSAREQSVAEPEQGAQ